MAAPVADKHLVAPRALLPGDLVLRESPLLFGRLEHERSAAVQRLVASSRLAPGVCALYQAFLSAGPEARAEVIALPLPDPLDTAVRIELTVASRRLAAANIDGFDASTFVRVAALHRYATLPVNNVVNPDTGSSKNDGAALYAAHSRACHSCRPNCVSADAPGQSIIASGDRLLRAVEAVDAGECAFGRVRMGLL